MALTKKQQAVRRGRIGGSECAALAGVSRWASPIKIYERAVARLEGKEIDDGGPTLAMELGVEFEEPVARLYAKRKHRWTKPVDSCVSEAYPYAVATPDRAVFVSPMQALAQRKKLQLDDLREAERGLEIKTTTWRQKDQWGPDGSEIAPEEYVAQVVWCMGVTGVHVWDLAVLIDRDEFRVIHVRWDPELFEGLYTIAERFARDHVEPRVPPPIDASEAYAEFLNRAWPQNRAALLRADAAATELVMRLAKLEEAGRRLASMKLDVSNRLKAIIGEAGGLEGDFGKLYWRRNKDRVTVDFRAALDEAMQVAKLVVQCLPEGSQRAELTQQVSGLIAKHTTTSPGARPLRSYWAAGLKAELAALNQVIDRLEMVAGVEEVADAAE